MIEGTKGSASPYEMHRRRTLWARRPKQGEINKLKEAIEDLKAMRDNAYCRGAQIADETEALGWEAKVKSGVFGRAEMYTHRRVNIEFGRHKGIAEAINRLNETLSDMEVKE